MILRCLYNQGKDLSEHQRPKGDFPQTEYPLTIGSEYTCVGMGLWQNVLNVLISDDNGMASYVPIGLFDVVTARIPDGWKFVLSTGIYARGRDVLADPFQAGWGYPELIDDEDHSDALMNGDPVALRIFVDRVAEARQALAEG